MVIWKWPIVLIKGNGGVAVDWVRFPIFVIGFVAGLLAALVFLFFWGDKIPMLW